MAKYDITIRIPSEWSDRSAELLFTRLVESELPETVYVELTRQDGRNVERVMVRSPEDFK